MLLMGLAFTAGRGHAWTACLVLGGAALVLAVRIFQECAASTAAFLAAIRKIEREERVKDPLK